jgi:hypothetical protein
VLGLAQNKNLLVLYSNKNSRGKHDATGAFIPEAKKFAKLHSVPKENVIGMTLVGVKKSVRMERTLNAIHDAGIQRPLDCIAFFGHGWPNGIQFGLTRPDIPTLCALLKRKSSKNLIVVLYACLAAENDVRDKKITELGPATDGGFADELRDQMVRECITQGWVDGHKTAGHTSWNPYLVRFLCSSVKSELYGAVGGAWLVEPGSDYWSKWVNRLSINTKGFRYRFPFMTEFQVKAELAGLPWTGLVSL